jgi:hypothetical protein
LRERVEAGRVDVDVEVATGLPSLLGLTAWVGLPLALLATAAVSATLVAALAPLAEAGRLTCGGLSTRPSDD